MLHNEWHKAGQYMASYFQAIEDTNVSVAQQHIEVGNVFIIMDFLSDC